ncbi:GrpB family protein [Piscinibacter terrae]|uniref:GrpB family protein n=1 Tax=Piscinibacter terrae TaxID=2496871 RepID=A0A3N7HGM1_9BURK|nr:GrpB family protein [Albitalea terrae]RQP21144.1 GrpB family protein [Albitalea terrae]
MSAVVVAPYCAEWPLRFAEVKAELLPVFAPAAVAVEHIGSTAIPGLAAKPIIDVLLGTDSLATIENKINGLSQLGYEYIAKYEGEFPNRRYFVRAAAASLPRVNLHAVVLGSSFWQEHLAFRNALRSNASLVAQYEQLKLQLASRFAHDRPSYTAAKAPFIEAVLASAQPGANPSIEGTASSPLRGLSSAPHVKR